MIWVGGTDIFQLTSKNALLEAIYAILFFSSE